MTKQNKEWCSDEPLEFAHAQHLTWFVCGSYEQRMCIRSKRPDLSHLFMWGGWAVISRRSRGTCLLAGVRQLQGGWAVFEAEWHSASCSLARLPPSLPPSCSGMPCVRRICSEFHTRTWCCIANGPMARPEPYGSVKGGQLYESYAECVRFDGWEKRGGC